MSVDISAASRFEYQLVQIGLIKGMGPIFMLGKVNRGSGKMMARSLTTGIECGVTLRSLEEADRRGHVHLVTAGMGV